MAKKQKTPQIPEEKDEKIRSFNRGLDMLRQSPIFSPLLAHTEISRKKYGFDGYAKVYRDGHIFCSTSLYAEPKEWAHVIAHCLLHLGMGHFDLKRFNLQHLDPADTGISSDASLAVWNRACDLVTERFLRDIKLGGRPPDPQHPEYMPVLPDGINDEVRVYERLLRGGANSCAGFGTMSLNIPDMVFSDEKTETSRYYLWGQKQQSWTEIFSAGLARAVRDAVNTAGGLVSDPHKEEDRQTPAIRAKNWFISSYPLLGAVAAAFRVIEEPAVCGRMEIHVAAVSPYLQEIYINPGAGLREAEYRFVMAHELLHAGLRHDMRHKWRDPYFWNVACDYVINQWLIEMNVGEAPVGILLDEQFKGLSAEAVYDRIVTDMRRFRKIATLRGIGLGDILSKGDSGAAGMGGAVNLDEFYRRSLGQGLAYHEEQGRGYLPSGLIEEIRALAHPPIPWDVELARWFDEYFTPLEKKRSYARLSRRQSSTPDIPRPAWIKTKAALDGRTFGVILDTSGSMRRALLANALGAIASYAVCRDVPGVRVVFCDAAAYDQGYLRPEDIAGTVKVRGRGGTVLQPGIDLLKNAEDFPQNAPLLIITDGYCEDHLLLYGREHAYLIPEGNRLPFVAKGKIFRLRE
jgi:predicted metal-dependent peptidase